MISTNIGISGWTYAPWRGVFYPKGLAHRLELEYASRMLNSIEINGSFYSLQRPSSYAQWYEQTPPDFLFSVKGGRFITHMKKLNDVRIPLANFFASGVLRLKEKLGPILWQFPPNFGFDAERFERFFEMLPRDTEAAAVLSREHGEKLKGRAWTETDAKRGLRYAVEIRHPTYECSAFTELLRRHNVAMVFADTAGRWPYSEDVTADFIYARLHGDKELYVSGYGAPALDRWAERLKTWRAGGEPADARRWCAKPAKKRKSRDVYVYFDNDVKVRSPFDAMALADRLAARGAGRTDAVAAPAELDTRNLGGARSRWPVAPRKRKRKD